MNKDNCFMDLTDADLEGIHGGRGCYWFGPNFYDDSQDYSNYADTDNSYNSRSSGFLNVPILSQDNLLNGNAISILGN